MTDKVQDIYESIGDLMAGLPIASAIHIICGLLYSATYKMPLDDRAILSALFHKILMEKNEQ